MTGTPSSSPSPVARTASSRLETTASMKGVYATGLAEPARGQPVGREPQRCLPAVNAGRDDEQDRHDHHHVAGDGERAGDGVAQPHARLQDLAHAVAPLRATSDEIPETRKTSTVMTIAVAEAAAQSTVTLAYEKSWVESIR